MKYLSENDDYKNVVFKITDIGEDLDFGCEERPEGIPLMAVVFLDHTENNSSYLVKVPDSDLVEHKICTGDLVYVTKDRFWSLHKKTVE